MGILNVRAFRFTVPLVIAFATCSAKASCFQDAAIRSNVDPLLLKSIAWQESRGNPDAVGPKLADGHVALGLMQINTVHLDSLKIEGITKQNLFDACTSIHVGAQILSKCITRFGKTWKAVGCYNTGPGSRNLEAQQRYVNGVAYAYGEFLKNPSAWPRRPKRMPTVLPKPATQAAAKTNAVAPVSAYQMKVWNADDNQ